MIDISIQIAGLDQLLSGLQEFPRNASQLLDSAVMQSADRLASIAQTMPPVSVATTGYGAHGFPVAPKYGGTMRQMTHSQKLGLLAAGVIADTGYSGYVHGGTSKMQERPFFQWELEEFGGYQAIEDIVQQTLSKLFS